MAKRYMATYFCGYSGTEDRHFFIANSEDDVAEYMDEGLYEYAENWTYVAFGWETPYTDEEFEDFFQDCGYNIKEISDEDLEEIEEDYGITDSDWEDITN